MNYSNILAEISNPIRMKILLFLFEKKSTVSKIKDKIGDISHSEISRHIGRLAKQNLITKEEIPGRNYELTNFGKIVVKLLRPLDFVVKNSDYFKNHKIDDISESFLEGIYNLESAELIIGTGNLLIKGKDFIESVLNELWIMTNDPFPYEIQAKKVNLIIPPHMLKFGREVDHEKTKYIVHTIPAVHIGLILSDVGQGFLFLPNLNASTPDYNSGFFIIDPKGYTFLKTIFDYFWQNSEQFLFDPKKLKEYLIQKG